MWPVLIIAQSVSEISVEQCLKETTQNYPLSDKKELLTAVSNLRQEDIQSGFLPQVNLNGQISYQSDVTFLPISLPNVSIPQTSKDWYKLSVDVSQLMYDGGLLKKQKELEKSNTNIELQSLGLELYKVKEMVQTTFFNITWA